MTRTKGSTNKSVRPDKGHRRKPLKVTPVRNSYTLRYYPVFSAIETPRSGSWSYEQFIKACQHYESCLDCGKQYNEFTKTV